VDKQFLVRTYKQKPHYRVSSMNQGNLRDIEYQVMGGIVHNQMKSRRTLKPIVWVSSPQGHFVSPMAESHPSN